MTSPLRQASVDQTTLFPVSISFETPPLVLHLDIGIRRQPKTGRCTICRRRRVLIVLAAGDQLVSPSFCVSCAGLR